MITIDRIRELCLQYGYTDVREKYPDIATEEEYAYGETSVFKIIDEREVCFWEQHYTVGRRMDVKDLDEEKVIKMIEVNRASAITHQMAMKEFAVNRALRRIKEDFV